MSTKQHNPVQPLAPLADRIRKLMPQPISAGHDEFIKSLGQNTGVKSGIDAKIRADYNAIKPELERAGNVCRSHIEIGIDLNRDQQSVRRLLAPDRRAKKRRGTKSLAGTSVYDDTGTESDQSVDSNAARDESQQGRTIKFQQSMTIEEYTEALPGEFILYFPPKNGVADPRAIASVREVILRSKISASDLGYAMDSC